MPPEQPLMSPVDLLDNMPEIFDTAALGKLLNKSYESLANDRYFGRGPAHVKYGRNVYYLCSDVVAFLTANGRNPGDR